MLTFLRKIRRSLIESGSPRKPASPASRYILYALGEVLLVMVGILLALQVNNWNENKKKRQIETEILTDLVDIMKDDLVYLNKARETTSRIKSSINSLIYVFNQDLPYHDSLKYHFGNTTHMWSFKLNYSTFETLLSHGINIIQDKEIRERVSYLYSSGEGTFKTMQENYKEYIIDASKHLYMERFDQFWFTNYETWKKTNNFYARKYDPLTLSSEMIPRNYEQLKRDEDYIFHLKTLKNLYNWMIEAEIDNMISSIQQLILQIEEELG